MTKWRMSLVGRSVLITGAARGIGAALAQECARRGARVSLVGLEPALLRAGAEALGPQHTWAEADVTDLSSLAAAVTHTVAELGGIDVVVANAGIASYGTVLTADPVAWQRTVDINLTGVYKTLHATLPHVIERKGHVLVVSSMAALSPVAGMSAYCASKSGAEALAQTLRQEVAHLGVSAGSAHPSWIDTDMVRDAEADLPSFRTVRTKLPWPANSTTSVVECATRMADGIERRAARVWVPWGVAVAHWTRAITTSRLVERRIRPMFAEMVPQLESDVRALGRSTSARAS